MKILILGSNGLVGSSFSYGTKASRKDADLMNYSELDALIKKENPDWVINCAGKVGGVKANMDFKFDFFEKNLLINLNVIKACMSNNVPNLISFMSTCIFPDHLVSRIPLSEDYLHHGEPHESNFGYAYSKRMVDVMSRMAREKGFNYTCIIPTNLYGENDNFDLESSHVLPALIRKIHDSVVISLKKGTDVEFEVWGSGKPLRQFLYAGDIPVIIDYIISNDVRFDNLIVSPDESYSISKLVDVIIKSFKELMADNLVFKPYYNSSLPDGQMAKLTNVTKFNEKIPFTFTKLEDGVKKTVKWFIEKEQKIKLI
jgi:GDP-L-fucose synthase